MWLRAALLVLLTAGGVCADPAPPPTPAPVAPRATLEVPEVTYDAGEVTRGTVISHTFLLKNTGAVELSVDAKPG